MAEKKIKFHLPGLSYNFPLNMLLVDLLKTKPEFFHEGVEIGSFFGEFPTSLWNGGRFAYGVQCPEEMVRYAVKTINDLGIPVRYTYTNPIIFEEDLADPYCNFCMQVGDNGMNEVMILSPILEKYIREKYPSYKHNSSTCKEIKDIDDNGVFFFELLANDLLLASGNGSLTIYDVKAHQFIPIPDVMKERLTAHGSVIQAARLLDNNTILLSTSSNGLFEMNLLTHTLLGEGDAGFSLPVPEAYVTQIFQDSRKNIWMGTYDKESFVVGTHPDVLP